MQKNNRIMADNINRLMREHGIERKALAKRIGVPYSSLTDWANGRTYPRIDKIQMLADFFGVEKSELVEEHTEPAYYIDDETARVAQELHDDPELRVLFDAARDSKPEDLIMAADLLRRLKATNPDG